MDKKKIKEIESVVNAVCKMDDSKLRLTLIGLLIDIGEYKPCLCISKDRQACPHYWDCCENVPCMETWLRNAIKRNEEG